MVDSKDKPNFAIPRLKEVQELIRNNPNSQALRDLVTQNDRAWFSLQEDNKGISNIIEQVVKINNIQDQIKELEKKRKEEENKLSAYIKENEDKLRKDGILSYDEYNNITVRLNKKTIGFNPLSKDIVISIYLNIFPIDKGAQKRVLEILKENGFDLKDFLTYSNFKISDALKDWKFSIDPKNNKLYSKVSNYVREGVVTRVSMKEPKEDEA